MASLERGERDPIALHRVLVDVVLADDPLAGVAGAGRGDGVGERPAEGVDQLDVGRGGRERGGDHGGRLAGRYDFLLIASLAACAPARAAPPPLTCPQALDELGVRWKPAEPRPGIELPVEVHGPLGGVSYVAFGQTAKKKKTLVLDCSLVEALARFGPHLTAQGLVTATYSGGYKVRNIKGTDKPSSHGFGLALDVHLFSTASGVKLSVLDHFETALGDEVDCIGAPRTIEGRVLKTIHCQMERSGWFRFVIGPDDDADHRNHFHIEALPWHQRTP
jgi:hypothetical protein